MTGLIRLSSPEPFHNVRVSASCENNLCYVMSNGDDRRIPAGATIRGREPTMADFDDLNTAQIPSADPATSGSPVRRKFLSKSILAGSVSVIVLALVTAGFLTRGFGLLPVGGSTSPKDAGIAVTIKVFVTVNSFSAANVLDNPLKPITKQPSSPTLPTRAQQLVVNHQDGRTI